MRLQFIPREGGPERVLCEAEIVFEETPLEGMRLVGFTLWQSPEGGEIYVTLPARPYGGGADRRYYDFLRSVDSTSVPVRRLKAWIIEEYRASQRAA